MWSNRGEASKNHSDNSSSGYVFEQQNDVRMNELGSKLSALKNITIDMHQDVTEQDRHLDDAHNAFGGLGQTLKQSYGRMNRMVSTRHKRQLCFYVSVAVCVFFVLYFGSSVASKFSWSDQQQDDPADTTHQTHQDI